ncbi:MAG: hypothetical protein OEV27_05710, partial [Nitrospira sp.]|nr:hypothetical protein [Nitrospira sp.]
LVGVDHMIQHNGYMNNKKRVAIRAFQDYLREQIQATGAMLLAEEFSDDALRMNNASTATVKQVADEVCLPHLFCDPGRQERAQLQSSSSVRREGYWLEQLAPFQDCAVLFVCGEDHVSTFQQTLAAAGLAFCILSTGWGKCLNPTRA